jgi:DNA sulfur modification protein DndD
VAKLIFNSIELTNFAAYHGTTSLVFSTSERNVTLVRGRNTGGKTSFINAIKWVLYGFIDKPSAFNASLASYDLFNIQAAKSGSLDMMVCLYVELENEQYQIIRKLTRKYTNVTPTSDDDFIHSFMMKRGDVMLTESESTNLIKKVAPFEISRFFLFDGELLKEYEELVNSRIKRADSKLVDAIEDVLGLPALKLAEQALNDVIRDFDKELLERNKENNELRVFIEENKRYLAQQEDFETQILKNQSLISQYHSDIDDLSRVTKGNEEYSEIKSQLRIWENQLKEQKNKVKSCQEQISELTSFLPNDLLRARLTEEKNKAISLAEKASKVSNHLNKQKHNIEALQSLLETNRCSLCSQNINIELKTILEETVKNAEIAYKEQEINTDSMSNYFELSRTAQGCIERLSPAYSDMKTQLSLKQQLLEEIDTIENNIDEARTRAETVDIDAIYQASNNIRELEDEIAVLNKCNEDLGSEIGKLDALIDKNSDEIEMRSGTKQDELKGNVITAKSLKKVFAQGRSELREHMRIKVEQIATSAYRAMIHEDDHHKISIAQNNYKLAILDKKDQEVVNPSAGATQILALALIIALGKAGRPIGPIVMDTPFGRLDEEHRIAILEYLPKQVSQLVLLYHSGELQEDSIGYIKPYVGIEYNILKEQEGYSTIEESVNYV